MKGRARDWMIGLVVLVYAASCQAAQDDVVVDSGAPPTLAESDVHLVGTSESIAAVQDMEVLPDGSVWVLNSVAPFFIGFDSDGGVIGEHGSQGGGPVEFRGPAGLVSGGVAGQAWTLDRPRHALIRISDPEGEWSEVRLPRDSIPPGTLYGGRSMMDPRIYSHRLGNEVLLARSFGSLSSGVFAFWLSIWQSDIMAIDVTTGSARRVVSLGDFLEDPTPTLERSGGFPPFPLWFRHWAVCSDSEIRVYDRPGNQLRTFAPDGTELDATPLPRPRFDEVSKRQFAKAVFGLMLAERVGNVWDGVSKADSVRMLNEAAREIEGDPDDLASFLPQYVDMRCGHDGSVWLQPIDLELGDLRGSGTWIRVLREGDTREIRLPDRFDAFRFTSDRIWGVQRDELDIASVAWIPLP